MSAFGDGIRSLCRQFSFLPFSTGASAMTTSIKKLIFGSFGRKSSPATRQPRASRRRQFCVLEGLEERVL